MPITAYAPKMENCTSPDCALLTLSTFWKCLFSTSPMVMAMAQSMNSDETNTSVGM